ncbi:MAG TPA: DUF2865 domain-containing protein, partial [Propylenella sp.]|nr:DUF2865 domain-containing protein [Propylenella sp.]
GRGGGSSGDRARYERAFREQARVLARTEARARNAGCFGSGFLFFRREPDRACRKLVPKLGEMQANLARLDRLRRSGGEVNVRRIRQVQRLMHDRGCGPGGRERRIITAAAPRIDMEPEAPLTPRGTFRTLCVRSCDGYYFPISFSTTQDRFGDDARTCTSMCPGADTKLYYHPNPGGSPEDMLSIDGQPYSMLPTAFQHRKSVNPSCSCRPAGGYSTIASNPTGQAGTEQAEALPALLPRPRPEPGEDPETLANRAGDYVPGKATPEGAALANVSITPGGRPIRVVGPAAYGQAPDQQALILTPVPN